MHSLFFHNADDRGLQDQLLSPLFLIQNQLHRLAHLSGLRQQLLEKYMGLRVKELIKHVFLRRCLMQFA